MVPPAGILDAWKNDEYNGMISGPAAVVEHLSGKLARMPMIGRYALATQHVAARVNSIARYFGFSRPTLPENMHLTGHGSYGNMTNSNVHDTAIKLTLDVKQETTIDSRVNGQHGDDEMTLKSIFTREAFLTAFTWTPLVGSETVLWSASNVPTHFQTSSYTSVTGTGFHLTPMCFASLPFHYWRGTIKYRFMVVATPSHRGKLMIKFDPYQVASNDTNVVYTHMLDLEKDRDFTVEVGWGQGLNYLEIPILDNTSTPYYGQTRRTVLQGFANGVIEVAIQNPLTCVNSTVNFDATILVFVSAGDDFELVGPDDSTIRNLTYFPQGGSELTDAARGDGDPENAQETFKFGQIGLVPENLLIHDGDPITSFRQCLKRYALSQVISMSNNDFGTIKLTQSDFPFYRGISYNTDISVPQLNGLHTVLVGSPTPVPIPYNVVNTTLLNYLTPAYVCRRGGLRRMYILPNNINGSWTNYVSITREVRKKVYSLVQGVLPATISQATATAALNTHLDLSPTMWNGAHRMDPNNTGALHVELPYHNNRRFYTAKRLNMRNPSNGFQSHTLSAYIRTDPDSRQTIYDYVSVAEDFNLSYFTGCPIAFFPPKPVAIVPP